jgi:hypothetical protein
LLDGSGHERQPYRKNKKAPVKTGALTWRKTGGLFALEDDEIDAAIFFHCGGIGVGLGLEATL